VTLIQDERKLKKFNRQEEKQGKVMRKRKLFFTLLLNVLLISAFWGQSFAEGEGTKLADYYLKKMPAPTLDPSTTMDQARDIQIEFNKAITPVFGKAVGYKAGLTNPQVQKVFGVSSPVRGVLMEKMILTSGATIDAHFGARPLYEGDLILRVGSGDINTATTPMEALKGIDAAIPFIELPDLVYGKDVKLTGPMIAAINVGARYGIAGEPIPVAATPEWMERLKTFTCQIYDQKGNMLAEASGDALLEHPINVVLWIRDSLKADGIAMKKGDFLSLGTVTKMTPTAPDTTIRARYIGLDPQGPAEISVIFK
jgi:2-keto-4-pentenoate hydratase